jgi:hypothetical protein
MREVSQIKNTHYHKHYLSSIESPLSDGYKMS